MSRSGSLIQQVLASSKRKKSSKPKSKYGINPGDEIEEESDAESSSDESEADDESFNN